MSRLHHSFTPLASPGEAEGEVVHNFGTALMLRAPLSVLLHLFALCPSLIVCLSRSLSFRALGINVERVISLAMIVSFHVLLDLVLDEAALLRTVMDDH